MLTTQERPYHFADFIRFVAMCAIIFQHSFIVDKAVLINDYSSALIFFFMKVIAKIGSISFFLISGFLLSSALERYSSMEYLSKRVKNIFKPYVLFAAAYLALDSAGAFFGAQKISTIAELPEFIINKILNLLFFTSYWFIFNYFISVMLLLSLRKYLYDVRLGLGLLCCTLIYSINVHFEWFIPHHTVAFAGFAFFLWLGANIKHNEQAYWNFIRNLPIKQLLIAGILLLTFNLYETYNLINKGAAVVDSSLKITNILYALGIFVILSKIGQNVSFKIFNPRDETYPLYLIHPIFLKIINYAILPSIPAIATYFTIQPEEASWPIIVCYQLAWFVTIYMISLMTVKIILNSRLKWIFGKEPKTSLSPIQSRNIKAGM